jgi:EAL and modified HD-GYP domain-containing signal transduction protein
VPDVFVARQPIFDRKLEVVGYELLFRGSNAIDHAIIADHDEATSTVVVNAFTELGLDRVVANRPAWLNVSRDFVVRGMAFALPAKRVVLELLEDQAVDDELIAQLDLLRRDGYTIALDDFSWSPDREPLLAHADIIKVELLGRAPEAVAEDVERLRTYGLQLLAEKVETQADHERCAALGFDLFQGYFFCKPETMSTRGVAPSRLAMLQLVAALNDPEIEISRLEELISRDVALSYRLLRYVNSAFFGLRREVDSIGRAATLLGLETLKRWATLTVFAGIEEKPRELIVTGLARARFCELAGPRRFGQSAPETLFTLGLFSVLDALMDAPMGELLSRLPFPPDMTAALVNRKGAKGQLLTAAIACERGEFPDPELDEIQVEAMRWATATASELFEQPAAA